MAEKDSTKAARAPHIKAQAAVIRILEPLTEADRLKVIRSVTALFDPEKFYGLGPEATR